MKLDHHEPLDRLLRSWRVSASPSPHFQARVWERIRSEEMQLGMGTSLRLLLRRTLEPLFARPVASFCYVLLLSVLGLGVGYLQGETRTAEMRSALAQRYLRSIDPYQVPR